MRIEEGGGEDKEVLGWRQMSFFLIFEVIISIYEVVLLGDLQEHIF